MPARYNIRDTPSYKHLNYSDFFEQPHERQGAYHNDLTAHVAGDSTSTCMTVLYGLLGVLTIFLVIKFIVPKLLGASCSASSGVHGGSSARLSAAKSSGAQALKSAEELKRIISGLREGESAVVMFHAPWCGHCKATMPAYESAAKHNTCKNTLYLLADCHNDFKPESLNEYGIRGFPTIKKFSKGGNGVEHMGGRSEQAISKFACE